MVNWIVSSLVYAMICFILIFIVIGVFGFIALGLATIIFAIVGGIKANEGELWESMTFVSIHPEVIRFRELSCQYPDNDSNTRTRYTQT